MALINCRGCQKTVSDQAALCPHCGISSPGVYQIVCNECKNSVDSKALTCPSCGIAISHVVTNPQGEATKSKEGWGENSWWLPLIGGGLLLLVGLNSGTAPGLWSTGAAIMIIIGLVKLFSGKT